MWAYAQAQSITFHERDGSLWPPLVHFLRHDLSQPPLYMHEQGRFVTWGWADRPFASGEHLKIRIGIENPLLLYLTRGIVTDNL